jgi:hypothetical protein
LEAAEAEADADAAACVELGGGKVLELTVLGTACVVDEADEGEFELVGLKVLICVGPGTTINVLPGAVEIAVEMAVEMAVEIAVVPGAVYTTVGPGAVLVAVAVGAVAVAVL